jgi:hypothetical protein
MESIQERFARLAAEEAKEEADSTGTTNSQQVVPQVVPQTATTKQQQQTTKSAEEIRIEKRFARLAAEEDQTEDENLVNEIIDVIPDNPETVLDEQSRVLFDTKTNIAIGPAMPPRADAPVPTEAPVEEVRLSRREDLSKDNAARENSILTGAREKSLSRSEYIETVLAVDLKKDSPFIGSLVELTGSTGFDSLMALGDAVNWSGAAFVDGVQGVLETVGEDSVAYDGIKALATGFGRYGGTDDPRTLANMIGSEVGAMLEFTEVSPATGLMSRAALSTENLVVQDVKAAQRALTSSMKTVANANKRSAGSAMLAEMESAEKANQLAKLVMDQDPEVGQAMILAFEEKVGKKISVINDKGRWTYDPDLARTSGNELAEDIYTASSNLSVRETLFDSVDNVTDNGFAQLATGSSELMMPMLRPEKYEGLVAAAIDLKQMFPEAFTRSKKDPTRLIDDLLDLTVSGKLEAGDELIEVLDTYNLSFEDYVLTIVGNASEAGKILNKLSQIKRLRPLSEDQALRKAAQVKMQNRLRLIHGNMKRLENIRRGGLVSQVATAVRNFTSATIRVPMEGLGNVVNRALLELDRPATGTFLNPKGGVAGAAKTLLSPENWKDSFKAMSYIYGDGVMAKDFTKYILDRPQFAEQYSRLFGSLNEIQIGMGKGKATSKAGKIVDSILTEGEGIVEMLNIPNRWQEHLVRNGVFFAEMERRLKNEWGVDFLSEMQGGNLRSLMNDSSKFKPKDAPSFIDLIDQSVKLSLDVTFASPPDFAPFKAMSSFITNTGLTVIMPFPRFMFKSMELMARYGAGGSVPLTKKVMGTVFSKKGVKLTEAERKAISDNLVGLAALGGMYAYTTSGDSPEDYKMMGTGEDTVMDTTPQYPLRQFRWLARAAKETKEGTWDNWFDVKEMNETFLGTNIRMGVGNSIVEEFTAVLQGAQTDLSKDESNAKFWGSIFGNYASTWMTQYFQLIDAERAAGIRTSEYKTSLVDPVLDYSSSFWNAFKQPMKSRGAFMTRDEERALEPRSDVLTESSERVGPAWKSIFGLNLRKSDNETQKYLKSLNFTAYNLGSQSKVPSIRDFENKHLRDIVYTIADLAMSEDQDVRDEWKLKTDKFKEKFKEEFYVETEMRKRIEIRLADVRSDIELGKISTGDRYLDAMSAYRKLSPFAKDKAAMAYFDEYQHAPIHTKDTEYNTEMLETLVIIGEAYKEAYQ